jgi:hypothetical protein
MQKKVIAVALLLFAFSVTSVSAQEIRYSVPEVRTETPKVEKKDAVKKAPKKAATKKKAAAKKSVAKKKVKNSEPKDAQDVIKDLRSALKDSKKDLDEGLRDLESEFKEGKVKVQHIVPKKTVKAASPRQSALDTGIQAFGLDNILSLIGSMFIR